MPLSLLVLFTISILAASASALGWPEEEELIIGLVDSEADSVMEMQLDHEDIPDYFWDAVRSSSLDDIAAGFYAVAEAERGLVDHLTCGHPKTYPIVTYYTAKENNPASGHIKVTSKRISCSTCDQYAILSENSTFESHIYYPTATFVGSSHTGPYYTHTHTYSYTCVCGYSKTEQVSAGCTAYNCVDPYRLTPPSFES